MLTNRIPWMAGRTRRADRAESPRWRIARVVFDHTLTVFVVFVWIALLPLYVQLISPYSSMGSAVTMASTVPVAIGLFAHLWRPRTAPWRTVVWAAASSTVTGMLLLSQGFGRHALTAATLVAVAVAAVRVNHNGRRLFAAVRGRRQVRLSRAAPVGKG